MTIEEAVAQFLFHCQYEKNLSPKTLKAYSIDLRQFAEHLSRELTVTEIAGVDKPALRDYIKSLFNHLAEPDRRPVRCRGSEPGGSEEDRRLLRLAEESQRLLSRHAPPGPAGAVERDRPLSLSASRRSSCRASASDPATHPPHFLWRSSKPCWLKTSTAGTVRSEKKAVRKAARKAVRKAVRKAARRVKPAYCFGSSA